MTSMCGSPGPGFAIPDEESLSSHSRKRELIPQRKQREFTPDTRKDDTYWDRRRRNNEAAKRSREKRRVNDMVLEGRVLELTNENSWLKAELCAIRDKCGIPKDAPPLVNPSAVTSSSAAAMSSFIHKPEQYPLSPNNLLPQMRNPGSLQMMQQFVPAQQQRGFPILRTGNNVPQFQQQALSMFHCGAIPNQHVYMPANMMAYNRMASQSVSPLPRSSSSGSRTSPYPNSDSDPRENGGAVSPSIAAVSSLLKLANSHFNGFPSIPREDDSDASHSPTYDIHTFSRKVSKEDEAFAGDSEVNNHLPLKLRHKARIESSCSPPLTKEKVTSVSSNEEEEASGCSGEDSAVDVTECDERDVSSSRKRKAPTNNIESENIQLRGELQRLASEVANLKVMINKPEPASPPAPKKQRKSRARRS